MKTPSFLALLLAIALLAGCKPQANDSKSTDDDHALQADTAFMQHDFYKQMKGKTDDGTAITLHIFHRDSALVGTWMNDAMGNSDPFVHATAANGEISLLPFLSGLGDPAFFKGRFTSAEMLEGIWTDLETGKSSPIHFQASHEGLAELSLGFLKQENCQQRERTLKNPPKGEIWWPDTTCSYIGINLLTVKTVQADINERILAEITRLICQREEKTYPSVDAFLHSIDLVEDGALYCLDHDLFIVTHESNVLCIADDVFLNEGGAHPLSQEKYLNIDLETGKLITLADILKPNSATKLDAIGGNIFGGGEWVDEEDPTAPKFKLPDNFALTKAGLRFKFAPYEIGPYAAGLPEVMIPYAQIEDLLLPGGSVARLRAK